MLQFLKYVFASFIGVMLAAFFCFILLVAGMVGLLSALSTDIPTVTSVKPNSSLHITLEGVVSERVQKDPWSALFDEIKKISIEDIRAAIRVAKYDPNIKSIFIEAKEVEMAPASAEEIRQALSDFKESGKPVIAYAGTYTQNAYYIASVADKLIINPQGMLNLKGLAAERTFYKNTLDKVGVEMQIFKVGSYKSAVEPYMLTSMSAASREQTSEYLQEIWNFQLSNISKSRSIPVDTLNALSDKMLLFQSPESYVASHLVDTLAYESDVFNILKARNGLKKRDRLPLINVTDLVALSTDLTSSTSNEIAILYASGEIVSEASSVSSDAIVEPELIREIRKLKNNKRVKAVVLRVNSPGGSAYSSDQIWKEVRDLVCVKPVVVSMGDYAASGGYYISVHASCIVAQPTTITGSIGIFGMIPNVSGLTDKLGVTFDVVKTNRYADMPTITRPMTTEEKNIMQAYVERGYKTFLSCCAYGRHKLDPEQLERIAQGRVWSGVKALELGLVDELGGIETAINKASELSKVTDYKVVGYPRKKDFFSRLVESTQKNPELEQLRENEIVKLFLSSKKNRFAVTEYLQARLPEQIVIR
ncbi:MAG: signal peptide peptidase SppA [Bacteroidales bacterium]|nr:signal peptide peptidase SppA [Bacteroidales bacterium]MDD4823496.1 signal peptide peptidase SppA [Bacteroidales bacterium]